MTRKLKIALAAIALTAAAGVAQADIYLRNGSEKIDVQVKGDKLYCTRITDGFEMCNGMTRRADGSWRGRKMQHPDMPQAMRFNGTVDFDENGLVIRGCAVGACDVEEWARS